MQHATAWHTSREAVVLHSFSKYFSMTGWRLGWMLVPKRLRRAVDALTGNYTITPPVLSQHAAWRPSPRSYAEVDAHVARYAENRALLLEDLPRLGIDRLAPADGAFCVYADVSHLADDSMSLCHSLLRDTGVATAPGVDFDTVDGSFLRISFAGAPSEIAESLERLEVWLRGMVSDAFDGPPEQVDEHPLRLVDAGTGDPGDREVHDRGRPASRERVPAARAVLMNSLAHCSASGTASSVWQARGEEVAGRQSVEEPASIASLRRIPTATARWLAIETTGRAVSAASRAIQASIRLSSALRPTTDGIIGTRSCRARSPTRSLISRAIAARSGCVHWGWSDHRSPARNEAISMKQAPLRGLRCRPARASA